MLKQVMRTIATILLGAGLWGADQTAKPPATLTETERLKLENISLRTALIDSQKKEMDKSQQDLVTAICNRAGVDLAVCQIDPASGRITAKIEPKLEAKLEAKK